MKIVLEVDFEFETVEEVKEYAHDGDYLISDPMELR